MKERRHITTLYLRNTQVRNRNFTLSIHNQELPLTSCQILLNVVTTTTINNIIEHQNQSRRHRRHYQIHLARMHKQQIY